MFNAFVVFGMAFMCTMLVLDVVLTRVQQNTPESVWILFAWRRSSLDSKCCTFPDIMKKTFESVQTPVLRVLWEVKMSITRCWLQGNSALIGRSLSEKYFSQKTLRLIWGFTDSNVSFVCGPSGWSLENRRQLMCWEGHTRQYWKDCFLSLWIFFP